MKFIPKYLLKTIISKVVKRLVQAFYSRRLNKISIIPQLIYKLKSTYRRYPENNAFLTLPVLRPICMKLVYLEVQTYKLRSFL